MDDQADAKLAHKNSLKLIFIVPHQLTFEHRMFLVDGFVQGGATNIAFQLSSDSDWNDIQKIKVKHPQLTISLNIEEHSYVKKDTAITQLVSMIHSQQIKFIYSLAGLPMPLLKILLSHQIPVVIGATTMAEIRQAKSFGTHSIMINSVFSSNEIYMNSLFSIYPNERFWIYECSNPTHISLRHSKQIQAICCYPMLSNKLKANKLLHFAKKYAEDATDACFGQNAMLKITYQKQSHRLYLNEITQMQGVFDASDKISSKTGPTVNLHEILPEPISTAKKTILFRAADGFEKTMKLDDILHRSVIHISVDSTKHANSARLYILKGVDPCDNIKNIVEIEILDD